MRKLLRGLLVGLRSAVLHMQGLEMVQMAIASRISFATRTLLRGPGWKLPFLGMGHCSTEVHVVRHMLLCMQWLIYPGQVES